MVTEKVMHDYIAADKLTVWVAGEKYTFEHVLYHCRGSEVTIFGIDNESLIVKFHKISGIKADIDQLYRWDIS